MERIDRVSIRPVLTELQEVVELSDETDDMLHLGLHWLGISESPVA